MLIAFAGLPSSGKSSTAKALGRLINAEVHLEPEESAWPELVKERATVGAFTALTWFRTVRVPQLFKADDTRKRGKPSVIDRAVTGAECNTVIELKLEHHAA